MAQKSRELKVKNRKMGHFRGPIYNLLKTKHSRNVQYRNSKRVKKNLNLKTRNGLKTYEWKIHLS